MRRPARILAAVVLLLCVAWGVRRAVEFAGPGASPGPEPAAAPPPGDATVADPAPTRRAPPESRRRATPPASSESPESPGEVGGASAAPPTPTVPVDAAPTPPDAATVVSRGPALLPYRILASVPPAEVPPGMKELEPGEDPVIDDPGSSVGPGAGGPRRLPYWSRWARVPPSGDVVVRGRLTDTTGRAVEGAEIFRVRLDAEGRRASPSSFQWVTAIGRTGADGSFEATSQPAGRFLLAADWQAVMRRPRGLDLAASAPVEFVSGASPGTVELRLPLDIAALATVRGVVLDESGAPKRNAQIDAPQRRERTGADGRFVLRGLPPGAVTLVASATGYAAQEIVVEVSPGAERDVEVRLAFADAGDLALEGRVLDEDGAGVAGVPVFLSATRACTRWATSGAEGLFRFESLPRTCATTPVRVMVSPQPDADRVLPVGRPVDTRVPSPGLELRVRRTAPLRVRLVDRATGGPLPLFTIDVELEQPGEGGPRWWRARSMSLHRPSGETEIQVPRGRLRLTIRAKDHQGVLVEVDVPGGDAPKTVEVALEPG